MATFLNFSEAIYHIPKTKLEQEDCYDENMMVIAEDIRSDECSYGKITCPYMIAALKHYKK